MICPRCQTINPDLHRYCRECGTRLAERGPFRGTLRERLYHGIAMLNRGALPEARAEFLRCSELDPTHAMSRYYLGQTYLFEGKLDEARVCLEHSLALEPGLANAELLLGLLAELEINPVEALGHFRKAHHVNPSCGLALYYAAEMLRRLREFGEATRVYQALHESDPEDVAPRYYLAQVEEERGHAERAGELLRSITQDHPQFPAGHRTLGDLLRRQGDKEGAAKAYRRYAEVAPQQAEAHLKLGAVLAELGIAAPAREALERALELREDLAEAHYQLGILMYAEFGQPEQAVHHLDRAVSLNPSDPSARLILNELRFINMGDGGKN